MKDQLKKLRAQIKVLAIKADLTDAEDAELKKMMAQAVKLEGQIEAAALAAKGDEAEQAEAEAAKKLEFDAALKAEKVKWEAEAAKGRRLPMGDGAPHQTRFADTLKYDYLSPGDLGLAIHLANGLSRANTAGIDVRLGQGALKALAIKLIEDTRDFGHAALGRGYSLKAMSEAGLSLDKDAYKDDAAMKAVTDPMYTGGTTEGGNWVHTSYSRELWAALRAPTAVLGKLPVQIIPDGSKSATIPLEGTDLTWYSAPEATASDTTLLVPSATVGGTQITTPTNKEITVGKMGARGLYSGELTEDSIINFVPQLREQLITGGNEQLEHAVIDGDTETAATTNINHIGGTPTSTGISRDLFLIFDGFRKLALVTNTDNSVAGGALTEDDYLDTMWLMGTAGLAGADLSKCGFIIDPNIYKKSLKLATLKTKDVWTQATMESGVLTKLWGYDIFASWFMHYKSTVRKANSAGKVDQTTVANNTYGSILGVRWDQWRFAYKRQMTIETTRIANADSYEIVAWARVGLGYRDTEASAISYGITV